MQVAKETQGLRLDGGVALGAATGHLQQLLSKRVQAELLLIEPTQLSIGQLDPVGAEVCNARGVIGHKLALLVARMKVKLGTQFTQLIQGGLPVHLLKCVHEAMNASEGVLGCDLDGLACLGIHIGLGLLLILHVIWRKFFAHLSHRAALAKHLAVKLCFFAESASRLENHHCISLLKDLQVKGEPSQTGTFPQAP